MRNMWVYFATTMGVSPVRKSWPADPGAEIRSQGSNPIERESAVITRRRTRRSTYFEHSGSVKNFTSWAHPRPTRGTFSTYHSHAGSPAAYRRAGTGKVTSATASVAPQKSDIAHFSLGGSRGLRPPCLRNFRGFRAGRTLENHLFKATFVPLNLPLFSKFAPFVPTCPFFV
eukprot:COSAG06_NODE_2455_length_6849_cov_5.464148_1_plen_172_part_00